MPIFGGQFCSWLITAPAVSWPCLRTINATSSLPKKFNLPLIVVIQPKGKTLDAEKMAEAYVDEVF